MAKKYIVTGEQYVQIDRIMTDIKRQIYTRSGSPLDPEAVIKRLRAINDPMQYIIGQKLRSFEIIAAGVTLKTAPFLKKDFFKTGGSPAFYFWNDFTKLILSEIPDEIPDCVGRITKTKLTKDMYNKRILAELDNPKPFTVLEFAAIMYALLMDTSNEGECFLFHVQRKDGCVVTVDVHWDSGGRLWRCDAGAFNDHGLPVGSVVVSRS